MGLTGEKFSSIQPQRRNWFPSFSCQQSCGGVASKDVSSLSVLQVCEKTPPVTIFWYELACWRVDIDCPYNYSNSKMCTHIISTTFWQCYLLFIMNCWRHRILFVPLVVSFLSFRSNELALAVHSLALSLPAAKAKPYLKHLLSALLREASQPDPSPCLPLCMNECELQQLPGQLNNSNLSDVSSCFLSPYRQTPGQTHMSRNCSIVIHQS